MAEVAILDVTKEFPGGAVAVNHLSITPEDGHGAGAGSRAEGVPARRAAFEPRCEAPRPGPCGPEAAPPAPRYHHALRDPRPGGGHDARRPDRGDVGRRAPAGGRAARRL